MYNMLIFKINHPGSGIDAGPAARRAPPSGCLSGSFGHVPDRSARTSRSPAGAAAETARPPRRSYVEKDGR